MTVWFRGVASMNKDELWNSVSEDIEAVQKYLAAERYAERLEKKYGKTFLSCEDLQKILGVGRNNVRELMRREDFPTRTIGRRKVVSTIAFAYWDLQDKP